MIDKKYNLWRYREAILNLVYRNIKTSYCNTILGILWSLLVPLVNILLYWFVFGLMFETGKENFALFLITGILPWNYFSVIILMSTSSIIDNGVLLKNIYFPRIIFPISVVLFQFVLFFIAFIIFLPALVVLDAPIGISMLFLPLLFVLFLVFCIGVSSIIACLTVFFRDFKQIIELGVLILFWMTPIVYDFYDFADFTYIFIIEMNPMTHFICLFQDVFYRGEIPPLLHWMICVVLAFASLGLGTFMIYALEHRFTEEL